MNFFANLFAPITSQKLEDKGQSLYIMSKLGMFIGLCSVALLLLICLISLIMGAEFISPIIFDLDEDFAFAYLFVGIAYLGILFGIASIPMYYSALNIFALGRIAHNTEK